MWLLGTLFMLIICWTGVKGRLPNIILIVADDYGWNDVGYHGSEIKTPNLDNLAGQGIKLENYYVQPICSPTRSQLLSGRYQIHTGLQHGVIRPCEPVGLPLEDKTLANMLQEKGYVTHMIGKWHIGMYKKEYLPVYRGFNTSFGYFLGAEDYYTHYRSSNGCSGLDFHENLKPFNDSYGKYSTHVFTERVKRMIKTHDPSRPLFLYNAFQSVHEPLQVPENYVNLYRHIKDKKRRTYAGMVSAMDEAVGKIVDQLKTSGLWKNTLLIFTTDNGGQVFLGGNNSPLRGNKASYFEGGIRGVGFLTGPFIQKCQGSVSNQLIHVSDWFPTLTRLVGGSLHSTKLDGFDQWETITKNRTSPRNEILFNIDPLKDRKGKSVSTIFDTSVQAAIRYGDWKLLTGDPGFDGWIPEPTNNSYGVPNFRDTSSGAKNLYLFNVKDDPEERREISHKYPHVVDNLLKRLAMWNSTAVPVNKPLVDKRCDPSLRNDVWGPWM